MCHFNFIRISKWRRRGCLADGSPESDLTVKLYSEMQTFMEATTAFWNNGGGWRRGY
jgi:hypothetical protein